MVSSGVDTLCPSPPTPTANSTVVAVRGVYKGSPVRTCVSMDSNLPLRQGQMSFPQEQMTSASSNIAMTTHTSLQSPNAFGGSSASLMSQMMALSAQSSLQLAGNYSLQSGGLQRHQHPDTTLDSSSILSRMVTAQGSRVSCGATPFRVASMSEFRRSVNSLNTVHESPVPPRARKARNHNFAAVPEQRSSGRMMATGNPLLKMMEERMTANADAATKEQEQPTLASVATTSSVHPTPALENETNSALQASINKWAGLSPTVKPVSILPVVVPPQGSSVQRREPLSPNQIELLKELTSSSQDELERKQLLYRQTPCTGTPNPRLTRSVVSSANVDRLRRENCSIQLGQQMLMQERMNEQAHLHHQKLIAASAILSMQSTVGGHQPPLSQEEIQQISYDTLNKFKKSKCSLSNLSSIKPSISSTSLRKRSSQPDDDDNTICTRDTHSSNTPSLTSSATSSNKVHKSLSHSSAHATLCAHAALSHNMSNLRLKSQIWNKSSMQNQSFSQELNAIGRSSSSNLIMKNHSFSSDLKSFTQQRFAASKGKGTTPSNPFIGSLLSKQTSAGSAAAKFAMAAQNSHDSLMTSPVADEGDVSHTPIKVEAEEFPPPAVNRTQSTGSEKVIVSAVPDSIKYQNVKADKKPIDIVKEALSSRGDKFDTKPSMDMDEGFFVILTEMYDQEVVNAIRSNDVECLRKLHAGGTNLQCGNRFGETLIHLACRRSNKELVAFLLDEVRISLRVRDDFGRTPMHDVCWRAEPDLDLLDMLLDRAPELLMLSDKRGHTPLCYSRREHWEILVPFLQERTDKFRPV
ncbi:hypothetical protein ACHAW5_010128 [Stephanodiscus triporus]|uniref:Uncharacterized protein n=1 Tax=Stephanodiscus triporus TaxID=2934178 RepID=A0ABD3MVA8_9STRA